MVDFNATNTIGTPPGDIQKILILEKLQYIIEAMGAFHKVEERNGSYARDYSIVRSRIIELLLNVSAVYRRTEGKTKYDALRARITNCKKIEEFEEIYHEIDDFLDAKRLTRFDTHNTYDMSLVAEVDEAAGL